MCVYLFLLQGNNLVIYWFSCNNSNILQNLAWHAAYASANLYRDYAAGAAAHDGMWPPQGTIHILRKHIHGQFCPPSPVTNRDIVSEIIGYKNL